MRQYLTSKVFAAARPFLTSLEAETAQGVALRSLRILRLMSRRQVQTPAILARSCLGLLFKNPLGLAAGCDKNGDYVDALGSLGFGHVEIGTVTPRPQRGRDKPRLFRIPEAQAVVNSMGFNNKGIDHVIGRMRRRSYTGVCGLNIGKNFDTPLARAQDDYLTCFRKAYPYVDYFVMNVSSPNTEGLRDLQSEDGLDRVAGALLDARQQLALKFGIPVPILVKLSPDLGLAEVDLLSKQIRRLGLDGVVATNTTVNLEAVSHALPAHATGGLSGHPLHRQAIVIIRRLRSVLGSEFPIIGVGGITSAENAVEMLQAGADLVQVYTGLIYRGPALIDEILETLACRPVSGTI